MAKERSSVSIGGGRGGPRPYLGRKPMRHCRAPCNVEGEIRAESDRNSYPLPIARWGGGNGGSFVNGRPFRKEEGWGKNGSGGRPV